MSVQSVCITRRGAGRSVILFAFRSARELIATQVHIWYTFNLSAFGRRADLNTCAAARGR